jgi:hypothetical protein
LSTSLAEFRPKLKQMDQAARQEGILRSTIQALDKDCGVHGEAQTANLAKWQLERKWHDTLVAEQQIVRAADADAHKSKTNTRSLRLADRERQAELLKRDHSEINVMRLMRGKPLKDYLDDRTVENSAEMRAKFDQWKEDVRVAHEVVLTKKELHIHR